MVGLSKKL